MCDDGKMAIYVSEFLGGAERIFFSVGQILGGVNSLGGVGSWRTPLVLDVAFPYHIVFTTLGSPLTICSFWKYFRVVPMVRIVDLFQAFTVWVYHFCEDIPPMFFSTMFFFCPLHEIYLNQGHFVTFALFEDIPWNPE